MNRIFTFYLKAGFIISLLSLPFIFWVLPDIKKNELTYKIWISSFFPQLIYIFYLSRNLSLKELKEICCFHFSKLNVWLIILCFLIPIIVYSILSLANFIETCRYLNFSSATLIYPFLLFLSAFGEEFLFRYVPFELLKLQNSIKNVLFISLFFSVFHLFNPNIEVVGFLNIIITGVFFCIVYFISRSLLLVTLIHAWWNFIIGGIFGSSISGMKIVSLLKYIPQQSEILSGGEFGFEGSVVTTIVFLIYIVALYKFFLRG